MLKSYSSGHSCDSVKSSASARVQCPPDTLTKNRVNCHHSRSVNVTSINVHSHSPRDTHPQRTDSPSHPDPRAQVSGGENRPKTSMSVRTGHSTCQSRQYPHTSTTNTRTCHALRLPVPSIILPRRYQCRIPLVSFCSQRIPLKTYVSKYTK